MLPNNFFYKWRFDIWKLIKNNYYIILFMNLFSNTNLKQFEFIKYVAENAGDEHVMAKIIIRLRYDKVEAPYYMETRIRISSCADLQDNGIFHAMDVFNHRRMYNFLEDKYGEVLALLDETFKEESKYLEIKDENEKIKDYIIMTRSLEELEEVFKIYSDFFKAIDDLV